MTLVRRRDIKGWEEGSTVVEFALAAPVLLAIIFGVIEVGRLGLTASNVKEATIAGARLYRLYPVPSDSTVQNAILARFERSKSDTVNTPVIETMDEIINEQRISKKRITFEVIHKVSVPLGGEITFPLNYTTTMSTNP